MLEKFSRKILLLLLCSQAAQVKQGTINILFQKLDRVEVFETFFPVSVHLSGK